MPFARSWGMNVEIQDLHRVVRVASRHGRNVAIGGHSLGGTITTAYATWDFNGSRRRRGLSGLVFIDGGSRTRRRSRPSRRSRRSTTSRRVPVARRSAGSRRRSPASSAWSARRVAIVDPDAPSILADLAASAAIPEGRPVPATNKAAYGYSHDTETSPPSLAAAQVHAGHLAASRQTRAAGTATERSPR